MIEVFKTNVQYKAQVVQLSQVFGHQEIEGWSFDLDDCDRILRVQSRVDVAEYVVNALLNKGFECSKLE
jgi:hypothetical protein